MRAAKKTDLVPGDIPAAILKESLHEFAAIIKEAISTNTWHNIINWPALLAARSFPLDACCNELCEENSCPQAWGQHNTDNIIQKYMISVKINLNLV